MTLATHPEIADTLAARRRGLTLALLTLTYFFSYMDRQILSILLEAIKADLKLSDTQLGLLTGLMFAVFYAGLGIPIARLADRGSRRNIIAASLAIWSLMTALCGLAQNYTQLALARIGVGIGEAGAGPPSHSIIADLYPPDRRASAMAIYSLGVTLGGGVGTLVGGVIASAYGWRVAMMTVGLPGVILALVVWRVVAEPRRGLSDAQRASEQEPQPGVLAGFASIWRNAAAVHVIMGFTITSMIGYALVGWGPTFLQRSLGMSMLQVSLYIAIPAALTASASAMIGGRIADRMTARHGSWAQSWVVAVMKTIAFPFAALFYVMDSLPLALTFYFVSLLFASAYLGPSFALVQHLAPLRLRALWAAIALFVNNLIGMGLGPLLVGRISDALRPTYGAESLRYAMLAVALLTPWAIFHYWRAGAIMRRMPRG